MSPYDDEPGMTGVPTPIQGDGADGRFPSLKLAGYALALFVLCYILYFVDIQVIALLVAPIKQAYGIGDTQFSLLVGGPSLIAIVLVGLPMARLIDRWNRRNLLVAAVLAWTVMNVLSAFAPSFWTFFALKVGVAMGGAWFYPAVVSLLADFFPRRHRTIAFTVLQLCGTGGVGLALALSGGAVGIAHHLAGLAIPLLGALDWWRWTFILVSLPGPVGALLLLTLREPARQETAAAMEGAPTTIWPYVRRHWGTLVAVALGVALPNILIFAVRSWMPEYFVRVFALKPAVAGGWVGLCVLVASVAGVGAGGAIAQWLRSRHGSGGSLAVVIASYLTPIPLLLALPFVSAPVAAVALFGFTYALFNLHGGPQIDLIQGVVPNEFRGRFVTFVLVVSCAGVFLGPLTVGYLNDHLFGAGAGIRYSVALAFVVSCATAAACWLAARRSIQALHRA